MSGRELPAGSRATWDKLAAEMFGSKRSTSVSEPSQGA
jgi:hypothetical protein